MGRFLGAPIDGVQFEDDRVILVEFKSGRSRLSGQAAPHPPSSCRAAG